MAGLNYKISVPLGLSEAITKEVTPVVAQTVRAIAGATAVKWRQEVFKAKGIWSVEKDAYAESIRWESKGPFSAYVFSDYKYAYEIETGRPQRDLKKMLDTSRKVRTTKDGRRFLVIPFRHNTPGNGALATPMQQNVYDIAKNLAPSKVTGAMLRPVGQTTHLSPTSGMSPAAKQSPFLSNPKTKGPAMTASRQYVWGGRLTAAMLKEAGIDPKANKNLIGTVRFEQHKLPGAARSSTYLSFRVMVEGSSGWIVPAKPGLYIAQKVAQEMQPKAEQALQGAVQKMVKGG